MKDEHKYFSTIPADVLASYFVEHLTVAASEA